MDLIYLTYLKRTQNTNITLVRQNHATQKLFYNTVLNISCNLWNTVVKVENTVVVWVQNGCQFIGGLPSCVAAPAPHHKSITAHVLAWGGKIKI